MRSVVASEQVSNLVIEYSGINGLNSLSRAISKIKSKPIGNALISEIEALGQQGKAIKISIVRYETNSSRAMLTSNQAEELDVPDDEDDVMNNLHAYHLSTRLIDGIDAAGTNAALKWNPKVSSILDRLGRLKRDFNANNAYIALAHELIHAYHILKGSALIDTIDDQIRTGTAGETEEKRVIGLGDYSTERFTENKIRAEHNLRPRTSTE